MAQGVKYDLFSEYPLSIYALKIKISGDNLLGPVYGRQLPPREGYGRQFCRP
jgi:hypothetical protein